MNWTFPQFKQTVPADSPDMAVLILRKNRGHLDVAYDKYYLIDQCSPFSNTIVFKR